MRINPLSLIREPNSRTSTSQKGGEKDNETLNARIRNKLSPIVNDYQKAKDTQAERDILTLIMDGEKHLKQAVDGLLELGYV